LTGAGVERTILIDGSIEYGTVVFVKPNSAADKAGLKTGDSIERIGFKRLVHTNYYELISYYRPGAVVKLEVIRNTKTIELYITMPEEICLRQLP